MFLMVDYLKAWLNHNNMAIENMAFYLDHVRPKYLIYSLVN